ncbi:MAG: lysylphosphatidylglycerol synthase transmembrane domain-containing protein [Opitutaceae bacterium]
MESSNSSPAKPAASSPKRARLTFGAKVVVSVLLILWLLTSVDIGDLVRRSADLNWAWLLACLPLLLAANVMQALSIRVLLADQALSLRALTKIAFLSWAWGTLTPSRVGEYSAVYYLKSMGVPPISSAACTFLLQILSLVIYGVLAGLGLFLMLETSSSSLLVGLAAICILGVTGVFMQRTVVGMCYCIFPRRFFVRYIVPLYRMLMRMRHPEVFIQVLFYQGLRVLFPFLVFQCVFIAVHAEAEFIWVVVINSIARIGSLLPISVAGLGVRESIQFGLFVQYAGVQGEDVIAAAFWSNVLSYSISFVSVAWLKGKRAV